MAGKRRDEKAAFFTHGPIIISLFCTIWKTELESLAIFMVIVDKHPLESDWNGGRDIVIRAGCLFGDGAGDEMT